MGNSKENKTLKVVRNRFELFQDVNEQIKFLKNDCMFYDNGDISYSKKIALTLRVLFHYTRNSESLLNQISTAFVFSIPDFIDISTTQGSLPNPKTSNFVRSSMCCYNLNHSVDSKPILFPESITIEDGKRYPSRAFRTWWENEIIISINNNYVLNRKEATALLADQDGGAHIDPKFNEELALLKRSIANPLQIATKIDGNPKIYAAKVDDILGASIRSIAEETLYMFNNNIIPYCEKYLD